jgi:hypothetical protein
MADQSRYRSRSPVTRNTASVEGGGTYSKKRTRNAHLRDGMDGFRQPDEPDNIFFAYVGRGRRRPGYRGRAAGSVT